MPERDEWNVLEEAQQEIEGLWNTGVKPVAQPEPKMVAKYPGVKPQEYPTLTRKQRITLAEDIYNGDVFTDRHCQPQDVGMVFMVMNFMSPEMSAGLQANPPGLIYEYLDQAGPRSCNGQPNFFSMRMLSQAEAKRVLGLYDILVQRKGPNSEREKV